MTSELKRFIELSDIIGIRLKCRACGCSLLIAADRDDGPIGELILAHNRTLAACPTCGQTWAEYRPDGNGWDSEIKELIRRMQALKKVGGALGCALELEIEHKEQP